jgi:hypothetical protein
MSAEPHPSEQPRRSKRAIVLSVLIKVTIGLLVLTPIALVGYRSYELFSTPDVGESFDVEAFVSYTLPDKRNAFTYYRQATEFLVSPNAVALSELELFPQNGDTLIRAEHDWNLASLAVRHWLEVNRSALDKWRKGATCAECLPFPLADVTGPDPLAFNWRAIHECARLESLEASRLTAERRLAEAWTCYRDLLRTSRHLAMRAPINAAWAASWINEVGTDGGIHWSSQRGVRPPELKQAIRDVLAIETMPAPASDRIKVEYLALRQFSETGTAYGETLPQWVHWTGYPAQMGRTARLVVANLLTQADRPRYRRTSVHPGKLELFELDPTMPPDPKLRPPEEIERSAVTSARMIGEVLNGIAPKLSPEIHLMSPDFHLVLLRVACKMEDGFQTRQGALLLALGLQLHYREHGEFPATLNELVVNGYLKSVPVDPYGKGEPFRYRREADLKNGAVVWSIGSDGVDGGGDPERYDDRTIRVVVPGTNALPAK